MEQADVAKNIITAIGVVAGAFIAGMLGFYAQMKIKHFDQRNKEKKEKEDQRLKFYFPLLRCLYELDDRFERILNNLEKDWLSNEYLSDIKNNCGFASDPNKKGYFIISSIYLIASFFGHIEAIKKGVDTTKLSYRLYQNKNWWRNIFRKFAKLLKIKRQFSIFQFDPEITTVCRLFQYEELFKIYIKAENLDNPIDASKLHKHIQHSIGEMMIEKTGKDQFRVKSFKEFYDAYVKDPDFRFWFLLIENLFINLSEFEKDKNIETKVKLKNDIRPLRLVAIQYWCRILMENIASELELDEFNLQTRPAENIVDKLSNGLKNTIINYKNTSTETYLFGIKILN